MAYNYDDYEGIGAGQVAGNVGAGAASGASAGASFGPWGALIGGAVGAIGGGIQSGFQNRQGRLEHERQQELNNELAGANADWEAYLQNNALARGQQSQQAQIGALQAAARGGLTPAQTAQLQQNAARGVDQNYQMGRAGDMMAAKQGQLMERNQILNEYRTSQDLAERGMSDTFGQSMATAANAVSAIGTMRNARLAKEKEATAVTPEQAMSQSSELASTFDPNAYKASQARQIAVDNRGPEYAPEPAQPAPESAPAPRGGQTMPPAQEAPAAPPAGQNWQPFMIEQPPQQVAPPPSTREILAEAANPYTGNVGNGDYGALPEPIAPVSVEHRADPGAFRGASRYGYSPYAQPDVQPAYEPPRTVPGPDAGTYGLSQRPIRGFEEMQQAKQDVGMTPADIQEPNMWQPMRSHGIYSATTTPGTVASQVAASDPAAVEAADQIIMMNPVERSYAIDSILDSLEGY